MTDVPCNGCQICCKGQAVILHPEKGDDVSKYVTKDVTNPIDGMPSVMIQHKPNGDCFYLGETGCTIYDDRPIICRAYDCRKMYMTFTNSMRAKLKSNRQYSQAEEDAAKKRLHTLSHEEKQELIKKRNSIIAGAGVEPAISGL